MKKNHKLLKIAGVLLLSAVLFISASAVTANTGNITKKHSIQNISQNVPSNPYKPLGRSDVIIWDMVADESWGTFEYRELTFDLSAYAGQPIQIAWRYVGIDGESFGLDDINVDADGSPILPEGFEAGLMPPTGWSVINTNPTRNWDLVDAVTYPDFIHSGTYAAWVNYDTPNPSDEWLITPEIDLDGYTTVTLSFWAESDTQYPTATMELHILGTGADVTPPVTTCTITGTNPVTITLTATDDDTGVNHTYYKIDDGTYAIYTAPVEVSESGDHTVYYYSVDYAGNVEDEQNEDFTVAAPITITIKGGLGVSATIKNTGTTDLTNVSWSIDLDGSLIFLGKTKSDIIPTIAAGESVTVKDFVIGLGKTGIAVSAGGVDATASGTVLLFLVIGVA
jgi:hypothetical protein